MTENPYTPLRDYLLTEKRADFVLTFEEIETILGFGLPRSAQRAEWWDNDTVHHPKEQRQAIRDGGYDFAPAARRIERPVSENLSVRIRRGSRCLKPASPSWCFPARRRCRCSRRRRADFLKGAVSLSTSKPRRTRRSSARVSPVAAIRSSMARRTNAWRWWKPGVDAVVVAGGDNGFNHLFVQPDIDRLEDLRGRTLVADVANTGWSFVLYEMLRRHGLSRSDYAIHEAGAPFRRFAAMRDDKTMAAAILNPPFAIHARRAGLKDMGAVVDEIGPYLGTVPYVLRGWAERNADTLIAYLRACIEGVRWILDPVNKSAAIVLIAGRLNLAPDIAAEIPCHRHQSSPRPGEGCRVRPGRVQDRAAASRAIRRLPAGSDGAILRPVVPPARRRRTVSAGDARPNKGIMEP